MPFSFSITELIHRSLWLCVLTTAVNALATCNADEMALWTLRPYAVHVVIAADTHSTPPAQVAAAVAERIEQRAASLIGPFWKLSISNATGADRQAIQRVQELNDVKQLPATPASKDASDDATADGSGSKGSDSKETRSDEAEQDEASVVAFEPQLAAGFDKLMLIHIAESPLGYTVAAVEYDNYVRRLGPTQNHKAATAAATRDLAFLAVCEAFSPIAVFSLDREDYQRAELAFRGADLPTPDGFPAWFAEGDLFQPIIRQSDREGNVPPSGVRAVPWTLFEMTDDGTANGVPPAARVVSHARRPFGGRRRGRVERLAIRLTLNDTGASLRLHDREDPQRPLVGYHVFARDTEEGELQPLGVTNGRGVVWVEPTGAPIRTLFVKSGSKLVAKLPMAPGAGDWFEAPLVDESKRIEAEARLSLLREELIDLVARRTILVARTRAALDAMEFDKARGFIAELEALPGLNVFNQRLTEQEQLSRSRNPAVQARIDKLFEQTRAVLGAFLSSREITQLRREVNEAAEKAAG